MRQYGNRLDSRLTCAVCGHLRIQELEEGLQIVLFDRSGYRPALNDAGGALLARGRRVLREVGAAGSSAKRGGRP